MRAHAISGPWAAGERVLVGVNEEPSSASVVRYARRLADRLRAPWAAIHVETSASQRLAEAERDRIAECLRLARTARRRGSDRPRNRRGRRPSSITPRRTISPMWSSPSRAALRWSACRCAGRSTHQLIRAAGDISVHVIAEQREPEPPAREPDARRGNRAEPGADRHRMPYCGQPRLGRAWRSALGLGLQQFLGISNIALVFLTAVLASAVTYGLWPSLLACLASVLAYNFFFLPPLYTFTIADPENVVALFFFAVVAVIASNLTARVRAQAFTARQRAKTTEELYLFARKLAGAVDLDDLLWATAFQIALDAEGAASSCFCRKTRALRCGPAIRRRTLWTTADLAAAKWAWQNNRAGGSRRGHPARREAPVSADAYRARPGWGDRARQRPPGPAADARSAPSARCPRRPGRACHRAGIPGQGCRAGAAVGGDRAAALGVRREKAALSSGCEAHPAISLQPEATGAGMEATKCLKPSDSGHNW